jgi:FkbH-like protein
VPIVHPRLSELTNILAELPGDRVVADLEVRVAGACIEHGHLARAEALLDGAPQHADVGDLWVRLARAWQRGASPNPDRAEAALERAAASGSLRGVVALAQHLERQQRPKEAIERWREAIRLAPRESSHALSLGRLYERLCQPEAALATYLDVIGEVPTLANYLLVAERIELLAASLPPLLAARTVRIALLGNATLDHLQSYVKVECYRAGLRPTLYQAGFDQYTQAILDPASGLYSFAPDVVVCAVHASRLFPQVHHYPFDRPVDARRAEIDAGLATMQQLLDTLTDRSGAMVLVHNMVVPQHKALGILDTRDEFGQTAAFQEVNTRLADLARTRYRNVYVVDEDALQARSGKATATDARLWLTARLGWSEGVLANLSREYLRYVKAARGLSRKCIVLDLDNTLWGGVIGEDGLAGIQLGSDAPGNAFVALQRELEKLWRRGILLAMCSKNNPEDALPVFEQHPDMVLRLAHFAAQRVNWQAKAANIREIARELNIGLDSLVFLDDNPVERAAVRAELPDVLVPELPTDPAGYRRVLLEILGEFDTLALTDEDRQRNQLYVEQRARQAAQAQSGSLEEYLANLDIVVEIEQANALSLPRIAQLTAKTNQFNLTTRRYTESDIQDKLARGWRAYSARVRDRYGDNGLTGVAIVAPDGPHGWAIDTLLLSCRVMGRGIETALLAHLAEQARRAGARFVLGTYVPSAKNGVVRTCYRDHGFERQDEDDTGRATWRLDLAKASIDPPTWLTVRTPELAA